MKIIMNTDGGARGNPGPAGIGAVVWNQDRQKLDELSEFIGEATNNVAEYMALIKGLEIAKQHGDEIEIFMDSELIVKQMNGEYKVRKEHLIPLYEQVQELLKNFKKYSFIHVRREEKYQKEADRLVNCAIDQSCQK